MHLSTTINTLLALSAGALAFPARQTNSTEYISKRDDLASFTVFSHPDCKGTPIASGGQFPTPKQHAKHAPKNCVKFNAHNGDHIGIHWGQGTRGLVYFYDDTCSQLVDEMYTARPKGQNDACVVLRVDDKGGIVAYGFQAE